MNSKYCFSIVFEYARWNSIHNCGKLLIGSYRLYSERNSAYPKADLRYKRVV